MKCDCCPNERLTGATGWVQTPMGENLCPACVAVIAQIEDTRPVLDRSWLTRLASIIRLRLPVPVRGREAHS